MTARKSKSHPEFPSCIADVRLASSTTNTSPSIAFRKIISFIRGISPIRPPLSIIKPVSSPRYSLNTNFVHSGLPSAILFEGIPRNTSFRNTKNTTILRDPQKDDSRNQTGLDSLRIRVSRDIEKLQNQNSGKRYVRPSAHAKGIHAALVPEISLRPSASHQPTPELRDFLG